MKITFNGRREELAFNGVDRGVYLKILKFAKEEIKKERKERIENNLLLK